jgi:hypothetical protein
LIAGVGILMIFYFKRKKWIQWVAYKKVSILLLA